MAVGVPSLLCVCVCVLPEAFFSLSKVSMELCSSSSYHSFKKSFSDSLMIVLKVLCMCVHESMCAALVTVTLRDGNGLSAGAK